MKTKFAIALTAVFLFGTTQTFAAAYTVPPPTESIIGQVQYTSSGSGEGVVAVQQRFDVGYNALLRANPHLDMSKPFPYNATVVVPTEHLLPARRTGIVINLPEMRMYYYPPGTNEVLTFPIGIGKIGKTIPITETAITKKVVNPVWVPPDDIREFNLQQGIVLPSVMPAGPDNPLGPYAIYMRVPTYLIHSTIFPESIGKRASFGCIRMYESDIKQFFPSIEGGIPVAIINEPVKVGWEDNRLYIEAHDPLQEHDGYAASLPGMVQAVANISKDHPTLVDWQLLAFLAEERDGIPHDVGVRIN